tara:strand:- start:850 stop:1062 length:213 start_codon:yes stop_codon:yes gene_type:complete
MKFMLIIYACSVISDGCGVPLQSPKIYDTYQKCIVAGHKISINVLNNLDPDMVNQEQLFFAFSCQSTETT